MCFQRLTDLPRYDLKEGTVYGRGQWASSIRYHDGRFYVWFSPNDEPHRGYIYTAEDPAGEWTSLRPPHHHDASLFLMMTAKSICFMAPDKPPSSAQERPERCGAGRYRPKDIRAGCRRGRDFRKEVRHSSITADIT